MYAVRAINRDDECRAITRALVVLNTLTPTTPRIDTIVFELRCASQLLTKVMAQGFSNDAAVNELRVEAANALNAVAGSLDARSLTQATIMDARRAVALLLHRDDGREFDFR